MSVFKAKLEKIHRKGYVAQLVRSPKRTKSISIKIDQGMVYIFVPIKLPMQEIIDFIEAKDHWILEKLAQYQSLPKVVAKRYVQGERFLYLGQEYPLAIEYGKIASVKLFLGQLLVTIPNKRDEPQQIKEALYYWYKENAEQIIREKVSHFEHIVGVQASDIRFKLFKRKWGSCDAKAGLDFNWFIILAPHYIIDYLVVHELTHIAYFSHSPKFWQEIEKVIPDYKKCEEWLSHYGSTLFI